MPNIEGIRERCEKATPGPWFNFSNYLVHTEPDVASCGIGPKQCIGTVRGKDADFIAHAREDIPFLLAEVEHLTGLTKHLGACEDCHTAHEAQIDVLKMDIARLTAEREAAIAKMNAYCLYCGADFGTDEAGAIALREHIEQCPEHPMQAIKEGRDRWKARAEALERAPSKHCSSCIRFRTGLRYCDAYNSNADGCDDWQFDEARFAGEKEDA